MITISRQGFITMLALHCVLTKLDPNQLSIDGISMQDIEDVKKVIDSNARASRQRARALRAYTSRTPSSVK